MGGHGRQPLSGQDRLLHKLQTRPAQIVVGNVRHVSACRPPIAIPIPIPGQLEIR